MNEMIKKKHYWKIPAHFDMTQYIEKVFLRSLISFPYWKFSFEKKNIAIPNRTTQKIQLKLNINTI